MLRLNADFLLYRNDSIVELIKFRNRLGKGDVSIAPSMRDAVHRSVLFLLQQNVMNTNTSRRINARSRMVSLNLLAMLWHPRSERWAAANLFIRRFFVYEIEYFFLWECNLHNTSARKKNLTHDKHIKWWSPIWANWINSILFLLLFAAFCSSCFTSVIEFSTEQIQITKPVGQTHEAPSKNSTKVARKWILWTECVGRLLSKSWSPATSPNTIKQCYAIKNARTGSIHRHSTLITFWLKKAQCCKKRASKHHFWSKFQRAREKKLA